MDKIALGELLSLTLKVSTHSNGMRSSSYNITVNKDSPPLRP